MLRFRRPVNRCMEPKQSICTKVSLFSPLSVFSDSLSELKPFTVVPEGDVPVGPVSLSLCGCYGIGPCGQVMSLRLSIHSLSPLFSGKVLDLVQVTIGQSLPPRISLRCFLQTSRYLFHSYLHLPQHTCLSRTDTLTSHAMSLQRDSSYLTNIDTRVTT